MPAKISKPQWVYFIEATGEAIKIGIASDVRKRLATLQSGNHRKLKMVVSMEVANPKEIESVLHALFVEQRLVGEWFEINADIIGLCDRIMKGDTTTLLEWYCSGRVQTDDGITRHSLPLDARRGPSDETLKQIHKVGRRDYERRFAELNGLTITEQGAFEHE